jgi:hypothetical protein
MSDQAPIEVTFRLTQRDLYAVYVHTLLRMWLLIPIVICMIGILALSALSDFTAHTSYLIPALRFLTVALALVGLGFALPYLLARNTMRTSPLFRSELRCVFSESGVEMATPASQSRVDWSGFHRAVELKEFVLLYMSSRVFYIVPKRSFSSPDQLEAFKSLVMKKMEGKVRLRSR